MVCKMGENNYQNVKNSDLVKMYVELVREYQAGGVELFLQHVKGHSGICGNDMADELAVKGRDAKESLQDRQLCDFLKYLAE